MLPASTVMAVKVTRSKILHISFMLPHCRGSESQLAQTTVKHTPFVEKGLHVNRLNDVTYILLHATLQHPVDWILRRYV